jgi:hypothetical protein
LKSGLFEKNYEIGRSKYQTGLVLRTGIQNCLEPGIRYQNYDRDPGFRDPRIVISTWKEEKLSQLRVTDGFFMLTPCLIFQICKMESFVSKFDFFFNTFYDFLKLKTSLDAKTKFPSVTRRFFRNFY